MWLEFTNVLAAHLFLMEFTSAGKFTPQYLTVTIVGTRESEDEDKNLKELREGKKIQGVNGMLT